jgi:hypothetical protein
MTKEQQKEKLFKSIFGELISNDYPDLPKKKSMNLRLRFYYILKTSIY